eukprot:TRINITY_DN1660_c0_g1_i2.p2 TRINITY_DN1660_c0_g1~~TRINITY_DN1660_c0_g1_i2.p2  ORF type:complete len:110 (+),score=32.49 TRINITY_DN1660_c0_g1_i2:153-482(+)
MTDDGRSIRLLLEAEQEANSIVEKARQARVELLKQARQDAASTIKHFREKCEVEFKDFETKRTGTSDDFAHELRNKTNHAVEGVHEIDSQKRKAVLDFLTRKVKEVKLQ